MATVLEYVLSGELLVDALVTFLKRDLCDPGFVPKENVPKQLAELQHIHQEFIPFFLNYLRDQTIHLLQSSKSATPSPAKTPSAQKLKKSISEKKGSSSSKRIQLFGASPGDGIDDIKPTSGSFFSPNTSVDVNPPTLNTPTNEDKKSTPKVHCSVERNRNFSSAVGNSVDRDHRSKGSRNTTPHSGSKNNQDGRSRHRFSLGEFIISPEVTCTTANKRKNSPYSSGRRNDKPNDNSPSPAPTNLKSGNKKRHSVESGTQRSCSPAQVFSLGNADEFPPVGGDGKPVTPRIHDLAVEKGNLTNMILKNSPNFDNTPRAVKSNPITKSRRISFTTIQQEGSSESPTPPSRRINPTPVSGKPFRRQTNAFIEQQDSENKNSNSSFDQSHLEEERELLRKEKAKHLQNKVESKSDDCSSTSVSTPTKLALDRSVSTVEIVTADIKEVTHKIELDKLVQLYSECLNENLFPNLSMELYFLMQLLTTRSVDLDLIAVCGEDVLENNFFCSVHNAVYFAVGVLQRQKRLLQCLDKVTLRLLSENTRISHFSPDLSQWLMTIVESKNQQVGPIYPKSPIGSVSFQAETDNRKNFPDDRTFHLFKKQRDGFYEILREWETNHMVPGWSVSDVLRNKIRALISSKTELSNHLHFARLFQSQLIAMCKGDSGLIADSGDDNIALLTQLKRSNPEKFKKLQERFSKPLSFGGPCPVPAFPGCQEFFHDFIIAASSTIFNQHLSDTFASKILELNSICFLPEEETGNEDSDDEQKELFISSLFTLRLLGKFLGFVTFLPYQTTTKLPDEMEAMYLSIRKNHLPYLDLVECIKEALSLHRLTLTIPWVVEFLSMMDVVAPKIDHFQLTLFLLLLIHRSCWRELKHENYGCLLIVTMISWLLDLSFIPEGFFFVEIPHDVLDILPDVQRKSTLQLDTMGFVDQSVFYSCCPYLLELRTLLTEFAVGCSSKTSTIRKITPVSAEDTTIPKPSDVQIQLQLEENFFHNHPASLRRCVDFVAERTASNFIKKFRSTSLQKSLGDSREALNTHLMSQAGGSPSGKAKDKLQHDILKIAQDHVSQAKLTVAKDVGSYCEERIKALVPLLLPDEQSDSVKQTSSGIATRMSQEKVHSWINRHITVQMFQSELTLELDRILKSQLLNQTRASTTGSEVLIPVNAESSFEVIAGEHDDNTRLPSEVLIDIKDVVKLIMLRNVNPGRKAVKDLLMETKVILERRQDWLPGIFRSYGQLVIDLCLSLFCHFPEEWTIEDIEEFKELWTGPLKSAIPLSTVMCSYSLKMTEESPNPKLAWTNLENLLLLLTQQTLLTTSELQQSCLNILTETQESIENLAVCLCHIMERLELDPEFTEECELGDILEWIYQICGAEAPVSKHILKTLKLDVPPGQVVAKPSSEQVETLTTAKCEYCQNDKDSESEFKTTHSIQQKEGVCDGDLINKCEQSKSEQMDIVHGKLECMSVSVKDHEISVPIK
ncbi:codanin-1-like [Saccostrea cucullata]|uniref:codanin-1-like n=1 Tax=Saccostrea cuccullata TaxID=36930 RepID=UPI002ED0879C